MYDHELEVAHHAVFMKGGVGTYQIDFACIGHLMNDLIEEQVNTMISFKAKPQAEKRLNVLVG